LGMVPVGEWTMNKYAKHLKSTGQVCVPTPECDDMERDLSKAKSPISYRSAHWSGVGGYVYWVGDENKPNLSFTSDGSRAYATPRASAII
jgi:hypothetical protein